MDAVCTMLFVTQSVVNITSQVRDYYILRESKTTQNVLWSRASVCLSAAACPH